MSRVSSDQQAKGFKTFPEFSKLSYGDRKRYEDLVRDYPPIADLSFVNLMAWWDSLGSCAVAQLNGNLVLSYWFPGEDRYTGLSVAGTNRIDETFCTIFDYLREKGEPARLVHVPEFVLASVEHPELFVFKNERAFDEYVFPMSKFFPLNHAVSYRRMRVRKFLSRIDEKDVIIKSLDLSKAANRQVLLEHAAAWQKTSKNKLNNIAKVETEAMEISIEHGSLIGAENVCLYIRGELRGFCLYQKPFDRRYIIFNNARVNDEIPRTLDYMLYAFAHWFLDQGCVYANVDSDLGIPFMRMFKLALGPENFFRKYTMIPA